MKEDEMMQEDQWVDCQSKDGSDHATPQFY